MARRTFIRYQPVPTPAQGKVTEADLTMQSGETLVASWKEGDLVALVIVFTDWCYERHERHLREDPRPRGVQ